MLFKCYLVKSELGLGLIFLIIGKNECLAERLDRGFLTHENGKTTEIYVILYRQFGIISNSINLFNKNPSLIFQTEVLLL